MDNRTEKLKDSIDETEQEIKNTQLVLQEVLKLKDKAKNKELKYKIDDLIKYLDSDIKFLEDIKQSDENTLNLFY